ncbi:MAG: acetyltransferase [Niabella sp.]|nr:acetyltransferase [Niabella sp.]
MNKNNKKLIVPGFSIRPEEGELYRERLSGDRLELGIRKADLRKDLALMYRWVNQPYAYRFWGMQGTLKALYMFYSPKLEEGHLQLFFACIGATPVALVEVYPVLHSELAGALDFTEADYGIHLLMAPYREVKAAVRVNIEGLSVWVLKAMQRMLFGFSAVQRIVAEPDTQNMHACRLAEKAGFRYIKTLPLEGKVARLYTVARHEI